jgi:hypothetical protein
VIKRSADLLTWIVNLFNPPPLDSIKLPQKAARVLLLTATLVVGSILVAMLGALGLYLMERGRELGSAPEFMNGVVILLVGILVNGSCVVVLVQMKRIDNHLIPPPSKSDPVVFLGVSPDQLRASDEATKPQSPPKSSS